MKKKGKKRKKKVADVTGAKDWFYSKTVKEHFFHPKNFLADEKEAAKIKFNGAGVEGSPACGDVMEMRIKVDQKTDRIKKCKWRTYGCASAIASTSVLSVMITEKGGMKVDKAIKITPKDILEMLGGLPQRKIHCSVLGDKALRAAVNDYFRKSGQEHRTVDEGARIIDKILKITDKDIENAVLEGATTFEEVQQRTKVAIQDKNCIPEVKELIRFYREKHFGKDAEKK